MSVKIRTRIALRFSRGRSGARESEVEYENKDEKAEIGSGNFGDSRAARDPTETGGLRVSETDLAEVVEVLTNKDGLIVNNL